MNNDNNGFLYFRATDVSFDAETNTVTFKNDQKRASDYSADTNTYVIDNNTALSKYDDDTYTNDVFRLVTWGRTLFVIFFGWHKGDGKCTSPSVQGDASTSVPAKMTENTCSHLIIWLSNILTGDDFVKRYTFCLMIFLVLLLAGCRQQTTPYYNNSLNIQNKPRFIKVDDVMYYCKIEDEGYSIVRKTKRSEENLISTNEFVNTLNYYDNTLIYLDGKEICTLDLKSNKKKKLTDTEFANSLLVREGYIYYIDGINLIKADMKSGEKNILSDNVYMSFDVYDENVYFQSIVDGKPVIVKVSDSGKQEIIYVGEASCIQAHSDGVYFLNRSNVHTMVGSSYRGNEKILKITNSDEDDVLVDCRVLSYNVYENKVFYINRDDKDKLYMMDVASGKSKLILDKEVVSIQVYGSEIFCTTREANENMYQIDLSTMKISSFS